MNTTHVLCAQVIFLVFVKGGMKNRSSINTRELLISGIDQSSGNAFDFIYRLSKNEKKGNSFIVRVTVGSVEKGYHNLATLMKEMGVKPHQKDRPNYFK